MRHQAQSVANQAEGLLCFANNGLLLGGVRRQTMDSFECFMNEDDRDALNRVLTSKSSEFSSLVKQAGLNPRFDLRYLNFSDVDFVGSDLRGFNFTGADLDNTNWDGAIYDSTTILAGASLRGMQGF